VVYTCFVEFPDAHCQAFESDWTNHSTTRPVRVDLNMLLDMHSNPHAASTTAREIINAFVDWLQFVDPLYWLSIITKDP
jgi:hypothetical protein